MKNGNVHFTDFLVVSSYRHADQCENNADQCTKIAHFDQGLRDYYIGYNTNGSVDMQLPARLWVKHVLSLM